MTPYSVKSTFHMRTATPWWCEEALAHSYSVFLCDALFGKVHNTQDGVGNPLVVWSIWSEEEFREPGKLSDEEASTTYLSSVTNIFDAFS